MNFDRNPVALVEAIKELVRSGLTALIAFGVWKMTQEQMGIVLIFVSALLGLISTIFVRSKVFAPVSSDGDKLIAVQYEGQPLKAVTSSGTTTAKERGFTLVELLIVIAIIGILAAIAIPNLLTAVQRGKQKRTMADMRTLATAIEAYAVDTNVYPSAACPEGAFLGPAQPLTETSLRVLLPDATGQGYLSRIPWNDGWGHPYHYATDGPKQAYVIVSTGRDGVMSAETPCGTTTNFNDDIIYSNGGFIQWPEGIQK